MPATTTPSQANNPHVHSEAQLIDLRAGLASIRAIWQCDICGTVMLDLHCKLRCTNCGFMRDCSDP